MSRRYYDVTLPFSSELPAWPGEPKPVIERLSSLVNGADSNVTRIEAAVHFATHVDAPLHFIDGAEAVETLALDVLIGPALVVDLPDVDTIDATALAGAEIAPGTERILFRTRNSALWNTPDHPFDTTYVAIAGDGAEWLVERGVRLVGIDYLSVEPYHTDGFPAHRTLLGAGVVAVEGLDLRAVPPGTYEMACLPMKIVGSDGAPARVVLWRDE